MNEIWKEIVGFSGYYVSSLGACETCTGEWS